MPGDAVRYDDDAVAAAVKQGEAALVRAATASKAVRDTLLRASADTAQASAAFDLKGPKSQCDETAAVCRVALRDLNELYTARCSPSTTATASEQLPADASACPAMQHAFAVLEDNCTVAQSLCTAVQDTGETAVHAGRHLRHMIDRMARGREVVREAEETQDLAIDLLHTPVAELERVPESVGAAQERCHVTQKNCSAALADIIGFYKLHCRHPAEPWKTGMCKDLEQLGAMAETYCLNADTQCDSLRVLPGGGSLASRTKWWFLKQLSKWQK